MGRNAKRRMRQASQRKVSTTVFCHAVGDWVSFYGRQESAKGTFTVPGKLNSLRSKTPLFFPKENPTSEVQNEGANFTEEFHCDVTTTPEFG